MSAEVLECAGDVLSIGEQGSGSLKFVLRGYETRTEAMTALRDAAPESIDGVWRQVCTVTEMGDAGVCQLWEGQAQYSNGSGGGGEDRTPEIHFEVGGRTKHIICGYQHLGDWAAPEKPVLNTGGLINVRDGAVEGVDVDAPSWTWSERHWKSNSSLTPGYKRILFLATGTVNSDAFRGLQPGEVKCGAISGGPTDSGYADLQFRFDSIPNIPAGMVVHRGPFDPITISMAQQGWDLLHFRLVETYIDHVGRIPVIESAHLDRIYLRTRFADLGIGS